jgi:hypothetical protein
MRTQLHELFTTQALPCSSAEWKQGLLEAILALIENDTSVVLELDEITVNGMRH